MKRLLVYGQTQNKKLYIYSLLKVLNTLGDVLFITQNHSYRRVIEDNMARGQMLNVMIDATSLREDDIFIDMEQNTHDFEFIVYDIFDYLPETIDDAIFVHGDFLSEEEETFKLATETKIAWKDVYVGFEKRKTGCTYTMEEHKLVEYCETYKKFPIFKKPERMALCIEPLLRDYGVSLKTVQTILKRGDR